MKPALYVILAVLALGMIGNLDYADQVDIETEKKERMPKEAAQVSPAPIWSKKCAAQGKGFIAKQADGGRWIVNCTNNPIRT